MIDQKAKLQSIYRLDLFFLIVGVLEIFLLLFLTHNYLTIVMGVVTWYSAYKAMKPGLLRWNYFVGIWAIVKCNPITIALIAFLVSDRINMYQNGSTLIIISAIITLVIYLASFILGIILLVKTAKYIKLESSNS